MKGSYAGEPRKNRGGMEEREISLIDLMVEILLQWRMFIVCMIGGVVLAGALSYMQSDGAGERLQMLLKGGAEDLTEEEMQRVEYTMLYEDAYFAKKVYLEKAPLMQIDSNNVNKAEATIAVITKGRSDIVKVYRGIVKSNELVEKVAKDVGMETIGLSELLYLDKTVGTSNDSRTESFGIPIAQAENIAATFGISVIHGDAGKCRAMLESVIAFLQGKQPDIEKALGEHEIVVVNESFGVASDMEVANLQKNVLSDIATMKKGVSDLKSAFSDGELRYYVSLRGDSGKPKETAGVRKKYILLGAVMAAFVYAFFLFLAYLFNTKIRATDNMQELYGIAQLGMIPGEAGKKKVFGTVDRRILAIRNHNKRQFSAEEALELAAVAAKMAAGKEGLSEIRLMGCGLKDRALDVCGKLKARLAEDGVRADILNNVLYDAQMMEALEGAKGVILVEGAGCTLYTEIAEELELLKRQEIKALGGILVG